MLGDTIEAQESRAAFDTVERLRKRSIDRRSGGGDVGSIWAELDGLDTDRELVAARAFTAYFELINLAEERERVRALREQAQAGVPDDGLEEAVDALADNDAEAIASILEDVYIQPTFTAHPTEARRKTVKAKLRSVASSLETLDERLLTDKEGEQVERELRAEVTSLWQTPQIRQRQPEPTDEALNVQWYLENTLFDVVGEVYQELEEALAERSAFDADERVPTLFEFRSWAGSDRDGNPFVTPEVTTTTLSRQRRVVLERYRDELKRLSGVLSQDSDHIEIGTEVDERLEHHEEALPSVSAEAEERYPEEPYRQLLRLMRERLDRVGTVRPGEYGGVDDFVADLDAIGADLRSNGAGNVADVHVNPLRRQAETFGFTLASLDLRDHQENHTLAIEAALDRQGIDYAGMDESERVEFLTDAIAEDDPVLEFDDLGELGDTAARVLTRFERLADWQREYGTDAIDTYCISMCEEPSHVLEVLFLADQVDVVELENRIVLGDGVGQELDPFVLAHAGVVDPLPVERRLDREGMVLLMIPQVETRQRETERLGLPAERVDVDIGDVARAVRAQVGLDGVQIGDDAVDAAVLAGADGPDSVESFAHQPQELSVRLVRVALLGLG